MDSLPSFLSSFDNGHPPRGGGVAGLPLLSSRLISTPATDNGDGRGAGNLLREGDGDERAFR